MKDNLSAVQRHTRDTKVGITFNQAISADGEQVTADVYIIGGSFVSNVNAAGEVTLAGQEGNEITVVCDFQDVPSRSDLSIIFRTQSGILARAALVVFAEDGYTISEDSFVLDFQPLNQNLTDISALTIADGDVIFGDGTNWGLFNLIENDKIKESLLQIGNLTPISLTGSGPYVADMDSKFAKSYSHSIGANFTLQITNPVDGAVGELVIKKTTASDIVVTLPSNTISNSSSLSSGDLTIKGSDDGLFEISWKCYDDGGTMKYLLTYSNEYE